MKWAIAFDLRHEHCAPGQFAAWVADADAAFVAVHVIDTVRLGTADAALREQVEHGATRALGAAVRRAGLPVDRTELAVVGNSRTAAAIADVAEAHHCDGIIISRLSRFGDDRVVHLGRTARRLLRRLPMPVVVVPPELSREGVRGGPILLAGDGHHDARPARAFADAFATLVGCRVELVHVYRDAFTTGASGVPQVYLTGMYQRYRQQQHDQLNRWRSAYDLGGMPLHETEGDVVTRVLAVARDLASPMIVCASRQLSITERIFSPSVGSQLASIAGIPIAIVPPQPEPST
jgi:nucleotide-binding universal stress UspA family protein